MSLEVPATTLVLTNTAFGNRRDESERSDDYRDAKVFEARTRAVNREATNANPLFRFGQECRSPVKRDSGYRNSSRASV
jgi:hypothetical protein